MKEPSQGGESATVENIVNTSVKRSEEQEQNGNLRIQSATPSQPCSSLTTVNSSGAAALYPSSSFVYSSTPVTSHFSMKRVSIPKYSDNKKSYDAWKAAFYACVDHARASPEYK